MAASYSTVSSTKCALHLSIYRVRADYTNFLSDLARMRLALKYPFSVVTVQPKTPFKPIPETPATMLRLASDYLPNTILCLRCMHNHLNRSDFCQRIILADMRFPAPRAWHTAAKHTLLADSRDSALAE